MLYTTLFFGYVAANFGSHDKDFVTGALGTACSDKSIFLGDEAEAACKIAAKEVFGIPRSFKIKTDATWPKGCIIYKSKNAYYNNVSEGVATRADVRPICYAVDDFSGKCEDICKPWTDSNMCGYFNGSGPSSCKASRSRRQAEDDDEPNDEPTTSRRPSSSHSRPAATPHRRHRTSTTSKRNSLSRSSQKIAHSAARLAQADSKTIIIVVVGTSLVIGLAIGIPIIYSKYR